MGAGGAAPPVKSEDVMILIGSTILLTMLVIQAWSTPVSSLMAPPKPASDSIMLRQMPLRITHGQEIDKGVARQASMDWL